MDRQFIDLMDGYVANPALKRLSSSHDIKPYYCRRSWANGPGAYCGGA